MGPVWLTVAVIVPVAVVPLKLMSEPVKPVTPSEKTAVKWSFLLAESAKSGSACPTARLMVTVTGVLVRVGVNVKVAVRVRVAVDVTVAVAV